MTGASGFIGAAAVAALVARGAGPRLRVLARGPVPEWMTNAGVAVWPGDLTGPDSLAGFCEQTDTLVHLASRIGGDALLCTEVNETGTANLLAEARRAGTTRVLYLSTCAVYRDGEHRGARESVRGPGEPGDGLVTDPVSATSTTRLAAERLVRAAGGAVLRPHLVLGPGDRHVVPALAGLLRAVPAWAAGGSARTSIVSVTDLAAAIAALALAEDFPSGEVFHVADPRPVVMRDLLTAVCDLLDLPTPLVDLSLTEHRARVRAAAPGVTDHQWSLATRDHWYDTDRIWTRTGVTPAPFRQRLAEARAWYRGEPTTDRVA